ncbi:hypothetical protein MLD38_027253 [Melastoma candidum]|uniref:Uncharacterized protein n=1 Tax=Melastoma candidum TaxID=119954 RepID=A0ACB9P168_9MYRT|nr:hypothetical protein MLD38_027253 [Melastoma candidum]
MDPHAPRPPGGGATRKRKVRGGGDTTSSSSNDDTTATSNHGGCKRAGDAEAKPSSDNKILAGYLAYEFLRKGTILGERFGSVAHHHQKEEEEERRSLEEVASILKVDGVHIPGIFNPSQLARWIRM